jgi:AcrR family transcriptional regulator
LDSGFAYHAAFRGEAAAERDGSGVARAHGTGGNGASTGPRRSGLVQERSRRTRQQLVNAAVKLWTERGFERGIEETTVEEIVQAAGVTKGTFYFHFAHKEDILLEVGWGTSEAMFKEATRALASGRSVDDILDGLLTSLARRITTTPRAAVARTLAEFDRRPGRARDVSGDHYGFEHSFSSVMHHARETGEIPGDVDAHRLGEMMGSLTVGAIHEWITEDEPDLASALHYRAAVLLAGVRARDSARLEQ